MHRPTRTIASNRGGYGMLRHGEGWFSDAYGAARNYIPQSVKNYIPESVRQYAPSVETIKALEDNAGKYIGSAGSSLSALASTAAASPFALPLAGGLGALALGYAGKKLYDRYKRNKPPAAAVPSAVAQVLAPQSNPINMPSPMISPLAPVAKLMTNRLKPLGFMRKKRPNHSPKTLRRKISSLRKQLRKKTEKRY